MAPPPRDGETLVVKGRLLPFSFFPVTQNRRFGLYDALFAMSPWAAMRAEAQRRLTGDDHAEALGFLDQSEEFHAAATTRLAANPLLQYYSFLNLGKALLRVRGYQGSLERATHGLSSDPGSDIAVSEILVQNRGGRANVFADLVEQLGFPRPASGTRYPVRHLLPQVVVGHRMWREIDRTHTERFITLSEIEVVRSKAPKELWLRLYVAQGDLKRYGVTRRRLLERGDLQREFREVTPPDRDGVNADDYVCFESVTPVAYAHRPTDMVMNLVTPMRSRLWRIVTTTSQASYRKYYVYLSPPAEQRLPQLAALWALFFYFGSIVRYQPHLFDELIAGRYGAFVSEFVSAQTDQLLYLLASEMCAREIARPAII